MTITRRTFFKIISTAAAAFILEKHLGTLPESLKEEAHTWPGPIRETIELEIDHHGKYWRFPRVEKMAWKERMQHWVEVKICDMPILQVPCYILDKKGGWNLGMPISIREGSYVVAYLYSEFE